MLQNLDYPFDGEELIQKYRSIKRELLGKQGQFENRRIAILGGSTTDNVRKMLDLFLLKHGIRADFYESEFAQYWKDAMFGTPELTAFKPNVIFIHTSNRNITLYPESGDDVDAIDGLLAAEYEKFSSMWIKLAGDYSCPIIQNNFEYPYYRLMGNKDASDRSGRVNFITRLNLKFAEFAQTHENFFISDINWISADYGLERWSEPFYWHMYKYALSLPAIPYLAHNVANIIKSIYGKNKKAFALDLDNTLWGGVVGDDGAEGLEIGQETSLGQAFAEFQAYIKAHKKLGIILNVISKNEEANALAGLSRPDNALKIDDFVVIKANWEPKSENLIQLADGLTLLPESFVFVDDNPAEREIVRQQIPGVAAPELEKAEKYIQMIDRNGWFEVTNFSNDDIKRAEMYKSNAERSAGQSRFTDYKDYLLSLEMTAEIKPFSPMYMSRIAQLTNKSNQFNLTTKRFTQNEITDAANDGRNITLYGKLIDKFGDNGVVSVTIGELDEALCHIRLWLMSCRVLKRDMEFAMMDELVRLALERGVKEVRGYYYPTAKNAIVRDFYGEQGFEKISEDTDGNAVWRLDISEGYANKQNVIKVNAEEN